MVLKQLTDEDINTQHRLSCFLGHAKGTSPRSCSYAEVLYIDFVIFNFVSGVASIFLQLCYMFQWDCYSTILFLNRPCGTLYML